MRKKKKFGQTTVGKILGTGLGLLNPALGGLVQGTSSIEDLLAAITAAPVSAEEKASAKEYVLRAYEAEVEDRIAARNREAQVAAAGGGDYLFKAIGIVISLCFVGLIAASVGIIDLPENVDRDFLMLATGAVFAKMTSIVDYFYGSSLGSKQKEVFLKAAEAEE